MSTRVSAFVARRYAGSTLIELMVAIIIGLIMVLASFQVLAVFEGHKRTTTAMNDALQSGGFGLYSLDKLARSSGTGLVQATSFAYGCPLTYTSGGAATVAAGTVSVNLADPFANVVGLGGGLLRLAPAVIFPGASSSPADPAQPSDVFMLMSGGAGFAEVPIPITPIPLISSVLITVDSTVGLHASDWLLVGGPGLGCTITPIVSVASNVALTLNGTYPMVPYASGAVVDLGNGPAASFMMFGVSSDYGLYSLDLLNSNLTTVQKVSDDIVTMHAVYGVDPGATGTLTWTKAVAGVVIGGNTYNYSPAGLLSGLPAATTALRSIKAMRVALIVRAPLSERWDASDAPIVGNAISAGTYTMFSTLPVGVQTTWTVPVGLNTYRYRVLEGTIPLRNASF